MTSPTLGCSATMRLVKGFDVDCESTLSFRGVGHRKGLACHQKSAHNSAWRNALQRFTLQLHRGRAAHLIWNYCCARACSEPEGRCMWMPAARLQLTYRLPDGLHLQFRGLLMIPACISTERLQRRLSSNLKLQCHLTWLLALGCGPAQQWSLLLSGVPSAGDW